MNKVEKETLIKVADYSNAEKSKLLKRMHRLFIAGFVGFVAALMIMLLGLENTEPYESIASIGLGIAFGLISIGVLFTGRYAAKIRAIKMRLLIKLKK